MAGPLVPLRSFEERLGVRFVRTQVPVHGGPAQTVLQRVSGGRPDEVWLKLLARRHDNERHTLEEWQELIERYRSEPAHPSDPRYNPPVL